ncbi:HesA/MoeB/ThiF family protein, partial [Dermatophilus congolensis]
MNTYPPLVDPAPELTTHQAQRYARHAILPELGTLGQRRLLNAKVLVIGAGGLGSPILLYLAAAGIGHLGIIDDDTVDLSNLQRQIIHTTNNIGTTKVDSARTAITNINPTINITTYNQRLTPENALDILTGWDIIVDGTDNFATRYLIADATEILNTPCVWGAILRFDGQLSTFWPGKGPVYRDLFPDPPDPNSIPSCAQAGVLGALCASIGSAMAMEVIRLITGIGTPLIGRLMIH